MIHRISFGDFCFFSLCYDVKGCVCEGDTALSLCASMSIKFRVGVILVNACRNKALFYSRLDHYSLDFRRNDDQLFEQPECGLCLLGSE